MWVNRQGFQESSKKILIPRKKKEKNLVLEITLNFCKHIIGRTTHSRKRSRLGINN
jgi:hypothetical protein